MNLQVAYFTVKTTFVSLVDDLNKFLLAIDEDNIISIDWQLNKDGEVKRIVVTYVIK